MNVLGFDIGGANVKASDADGNAVSHPFPMWTRFRELESTLQNLNCGHSAPDLVAVTMTAELADCFLTKQEGVDFIITSVQKAFPATPIRVWLTSGEFAEPEDARELPGLVAAANWHALATWSGRAVPDGPAILIDVGSTTVDIIPLLDGRPIPRGLNDGERLRSGELVYTGFGRTPVCAILQRVDLGGEQVPVAAEMFATSADAYLVAGFQSENEDCTETADGRAFTRENSLNRLAHMVCCDSTELPDLEIERIAQQIIVAQSEQLHAAFESVFHRLGNTLQADSGRSIIVEKPTVMVSGSGIVLAKFALDRFGADRLAELLQLQEMFGRNIAESACAFAVARLAHDLCRDDVIEVSAFQ